MTRLVVDREQIAQFVAAIYRHVSPDRTIWMRAFGEGPNKDFLEVRLVKTKGKDLQPVIDAAVQLAQEAADAPGPHVDHV